MTLGKTAGSKIKNSNLLLVLVKKCKEPKPKRYYDLSDILGGKI